MRFIFGFIVGIVLTIVGAYVHDSLDAGAAKPLVNWTNVADLEQATYDYVKAQFDRLVKWATSN
jgi:hypothetical protein